MTVYTIGAEHLAEATKRLDKVAKKAQVLGVAPVVYTVGAVRLEAVMEDLRPYGSLQPMLTPTGEFYEVVDLDVDAPLVKLEGWTVVAQIQHEAAGNLIRFVNAPEDEAVRAELANGWRHAEPTCAHCSGKRRRLNTYALRNDAGEQVRVGASCVQDFTRGHNVDRFLKLMEEVGSLLSGALNDYPGGSSREAYFVKTADYLVHVATMIRTEGWVPKTGAGDRTPTSQAASSNLFHFTRGTRITHGPQRGQPDFTAPTDVDVAQADAALAWVRALPEREILRSDFLGNLFVAASADTTSPRNLGIVAAAIGAHTRALGRQVEYARKAVVSAGSAKVGDVGDMLRGLVLTVEYTQDFPGDFAPRRLTRMASAEGNIFTWWATEGALEVGQRVTLDGKVKGHEVRNGGIHTILTRCRVKEVQDAVAVA